MLASVWVGSPALLQFLGKTIFPFHLSVLPSIPDTPFVWGALALVLLCIVGFKTGNRAVYAFGCIWFIIFILPSFLRPETYTVPYFLEHRLYLPLLGVLLMAGSYPPLFRERKSHAVAFLLVLALFTGITIWNGRFYRDRTAYWTRAVETAPRQPIGYKNLGNVYYMEGRFEEAERYYLETLRLNRYEPMVYNNLGLIHAYRDEFGPAKEDFIKALQMDPNYVDAWYHLGLLYASTGDSSLMVQSWEKALSLHPDHVGALVQMCRYCLRKGDREGYGIYLDRLHRLRIELPSDLSE